MLLLFVTRVLQLAISSAPSSLCSSCTRCASLPQSRLRPPCEISSSPSLLQHCIPLHARAFVFLAQSNPCDVTPLVQPHHGASVSQVAGARVCCAEHRRVGCFRPLPAVCAVVAYMCVFVYLCLCVCMCVCANINESNFKLFCKKRMQLCGWANQQPGTLGCSSVQPCRMNMSLTWQIQRCYHGKEQTRGSIRCCT